MAVLQDDKKGIGLLCLDEGFPEHVFVKEEVVDNLSIKEEPWLWEETELVEDVKTLEETDAGSRGNSSFFSEKLIINPPVLGEDNPSLDILPKITTNNESSSKTKYTDKPFACIHCKYRTDDKSYFRKHLLRHNVIYKSDTIAKHLIIHQSVKDQQFACNHCEYKSQVKKNLKSHLLTHHNVRVKPFVCNHCCYRTDQISHLQRHLLIHESVRDKPLACSHCEYKSDCKSTLKYHLLTHVSFQERPYGCNHCEYRAALKPTLRKHVLRKH